MAGASRRLIWAPSAEQDLHEIWRYFARVASEHIADKLLRDIAQTAGRLGDRPYIGRSRDEVLPGLRSVLAHPYAVFYRVNNENVEIVRVLHERRDFPSALKNQEQ